MNQDIKYLDAEKGEELVQLREGTNKENLHSYNQPVYLVEESERAQT